MPNLDANAIVLLNIPMDAETPSGRLLRPQAMVQEELLRRYGIHISAFCVSQLNHYCHTVSTVAYRMDLKKARSKVESERQEEERRFKSTLAALQQDNRLKLVITDSQAMDVCHKWTLADPTTENQGTTVQRAAQLEPGVVPAVALTTFSVVMINYLSGGRLSKFVGGLKKFDHLGKGSRVLICEACNHDRIQV